MTAWMQYRRASARLDIPETPKVHLVGHLIFGPRRLEASELNLFLFFIFLILILALSSLICELCVFGCWLLMLGFYVLIVVYVC